MRNKLYIVMIEDPPTPIEYFLSNKQAGIYREFLWGLEDTAGVERTPYIIHQSNLNVKASEVIERDMNSGYDDEDEYFYA